MGKMILLLVPANGTLNYKGLLRDSAAKESMNQWKLCEGNAAALICKGLMCFAMRCTTPS